MTNEQLASTLLSSRVWDEAADQPFRPEVLVDVAENDLPVIAPDLDLYLDAVLGEFSHATSLRLTPAVAQGS